jgi:hypothetical protein
MVCAELAGVEDDAAVPSSGPNWILNARLE